MPWRGPSGASAHVRGLASALVARGHEVRVAVACEVDHRGAHDETPDIPVVVGPRTPGGGPGWWRRAMLTRDALHLAQAAVREWQPHLIWERHARHTAKAGTWLRKQGLTRCVEVNAPLSREQAGEAHGAARGEREEAQSLMSADHVVAVSPWLVEWVRSVGCDPSRVRCVPNATSLRPGGDREGTRRRLELEGPVLGFVGSCRPWHGLDRIPALLDRLPHVRALVVGEGPVAPPEHPRLVHLGRVEQAELADVIAAIDVGLLPYAADAPPWFCPLKLFDYQSQGVPVVASDVGDLSSMVGEGGTVVPAEDLPGWVEAIERALVMPRKARVRSWENVVDEVLDLARTPQAVRHRTVS